MRQYVYDFSLLAPVPSDVTIATFPREQIDRLFSKKTHYLDWMRFFWIGVMVKLARAGQLGSAGRYRVVISYTGNGNYECVLLRSI
ncbi:hypothetical protein SEA_KARDASHIAN_33 [Streptomyces phage Kardashian]|nr:hypothetical protein SEA_KARDASHIAN_33 [Streptomyces phage Kardashian]